jgi:hypothetical protein
MMALNASVCCEPFARAFSALRRIAAIGFLISYASPAASLPIEASLSAFCDLPVELLRLPSRFAKTFPGVIERCDDAVKLLFS